MQHRPGYVRHSAPVSICVVASQKINLSPLISEEVDVIRHQDVGKEAEAVALLILGQIRQIALIVARREEDLLTGVAAADDVIEHAGNFEAGFARHGELIAWPNHKSQV